MAIQKKILTRQEDGSMPQYITAAGAVKSDKALQGGVGILALGKPGDILTRAYGPVVRALPVVAADLPVGGAYVPFGSYVAGKGILVNSGDCAAIGYQFETVKGLKAGQTGSFLVSGACVVLKSQVAAISAAMKVQYLSDDYAAAAATDVVEIEVNGFDADVTPTSAS